MSDYTYSRRCKSKRDPCPAECPEYPDCFSFYPEKPRQCPTGPTGPAGPTGPSGNGDAGLTVLPFSSGPELVTLQNFENIEQIIPNAIIMAFGSFENIQYGGGPLVIGTDTGVIGAYDVPLATSADGILRGIRLNFRTSGVGPDPFPLPAGTAVFIDVLQSLPANYNSYQVIASAGVDIPFDVENGVYSVKVEPDVAVAADASLLVAVRLEFPGTVVIQLSGRVSASLLLEFPAQ